MKVVEVNYTDLPGRIFNGYDLHLELNKRGIYATQNVLHKLSNTGTVYEIIKDTLVQMQLEEYEKINQISHLIYPNAAIFERMKNVKEADLIHYHIIHNHMFSLYDYELLMNSHRSIWTLHDPWILTGDCIYPLTCDKWKSGCENCINTDGYGYAAKPDNTHFMWEMKKELLKSINPHIVVSCGFMKEYIQNSPLTKHFKQIHTIPFGVKLDDKEKKKGEDKDFFSIDKKDIVIGFRAEEGSIKGGKYICDALRNLNIEGHITIITVGSAKMPDDIHRKYNVIELGWVNDDVLMKRFWNVVDVFIMPSLAESFGLMAIEAMAQRCSVVCFKNTTVEEITEAPECGVAADYASASSLKQKLVDLIQNKDEIIYRGNLGRKIVESKYRFDMYVDRHIELYKKVMMEK